MENKESEVVWLKWQDVCVRYSFSRSTLYRLANEGTFPKPRRIGSALTRWSAKELEEYDASLVAGAPLMECE